MFDGMFDGMNKQMADMTKGQNIATKLQLAFKLTALCVQYNKSPAEVVKLFKEVTTEMGKI